MDRGNWILADVRTSDALDRLVITPRRPADRASVGGILRQALPGVAVRLSEDGFVIPDPAAHLLGAEVSPAFRWSFEALRFVENRAWVRRVHPSYRAEVRTILNEGPAGAAARLNGSDATGVLDDHQLVNVAAMTAPDGYGMCVFDEQGAGKTVTLIFAFDTLVAKDEVDLALIVAPKSMVPEWPRDFARFRGDLYRVVTATGSRAEKRSALRSLPDVLVANFETATTLEDELASLLRRYGRRALLVVDESFFVKNFEAQRTRAIRRLRELVGRAFVLCGTPVPNSPVDIVQQFNVVDFGLTFGELKIPDDRVEATAVVQGAMERRGVYVRHLKRDVLPTLPRKSFTRIDVPLQPEQDVLYRSTLEDLTRDARAIDDEAFRQQRTSFLARRSALLQICSNPSRIAPAYREIPSKLLVLDDLLEDLISHRLEKVVVWSFYTASLEAVVDRYARFNPVRFDGSVGVEDRRSAVQRFQEDDSTMLFVANPAAGGAGITLHRARYAIYESVSNQAAHYLQSLDRIHRRGQEREVEYLLLACADTIETLEYDRLGNKEAAAQELLGDPAPNAITRRSFLQELEKASELLQIDRPR